MFATGYELPDRVPHRGHTIRSTRASATVALKRRLWPEQCMIWEASDPYLYLRTTPDGGSSAVARTKSFSDDGKRDALLAEPRLCDPLNGRLATEEQRYRTGNEVHRCAANGRTG